MGECRRRPVEHSGTTPRGRSRQGLRVLSCGSTRVNEVVVGFAPSSTIAALPNRRRARRFSHRRRRGGTPRRRIGRPTPAGSRRGRRRRRRPRAMAVCSRGRLGARSMEERAGPDCHRLRLRRRHTRSRRPARTRRPTPAGSRRDRWRTRTARAPARRSPSQLSVGNNRPAVARRRHRRSSRLRRHRRHGRRRWGRVACPRMPHRRTAR